MRSERQDHTLQPTALVHEAYLRMLPAAVDWRDRAHFLALTARAMRRVLIDHARAKGRAKRADAGQQVTLSEEVLSRGSADVDLRILDQALDRLEALDERKARFVEMRYLAGLSNREIAEAMGVSERTVKRELQFGRAWLRREIEEIGLLLQASRVLDQGNYGFEPANLFVSAMDLDTAQYSLAEVEAFSRRLRASVAPLPGVESVSIADGVPLDYDQSFRRVVAVTGQANPVLVETTRIGPDFFETIRTPGAKLALPGIVVGSALGFLLGRQIMAGWYDFLGRSALDPAVLAFGAGTALAVVLLASSIGARRAASVEFMKALRRD